ncbi:hypothetical protein MRX96_031146 [Rhipicephalus microplus]
MPDLWSPWRFAARERCASHYIINGRARYAYILRGERHAGPLPEFDVRLVRLNEFAIKGKRDAPPSCFRMFCCACSVPRNPTRHRRPLSQRRSDQCTSERARGAHRYSSHFPSFMLHSKNTAFFPFQRGPDSEINVRRGEIEIEAAPWRALTRRTPFSRRAPSSRTSCTREPHRGLEKRKE